MLAAAKSAGIHYLHYLNHNDQRTPAVQLAKRLIDDGRIGEIRRWRGCYQ